MGSDDFLVVCSSSQCAAAAGGDLVRRVAGIQEEKCGGSVAAGVEVGDNVSYLLHGLHGRSEFENGVVHEEAFREVHLPISLLRIFLV